MMNRILVGLRRYEERTRPRYSRLFARLASGQAPQALLISGVDSRLVPSLFASSAPGDLFEVRNIANLVPPHGASAEASVPSAVSYALEVLGIEDIIVCGHSECGGKFVRAVDAVNESSAAEAVGVA